MANRMMRCQNACMMSSDFPNDRTTMNTGNTHTHAPRYQCSKPERRSVHRSIVLLQASDVDRYRAGSSMKIWL